MTDRQIFSVCLWIIALWSAAAALILLPGIPGS
jgi:hypothetical protein